MDRRVYLVNLTAKQARQRASEVRLTVEAREKTRGKQSREVKTQDAKPWGERLYGANQAVNDDSHSVDDDSTAPPIAKARQRKACTEHHYLSEL